MAAETEDVSAANKRSPSDCIDNGIGQYGILGAKRTRVTLQILFAIMAVIMNVMIMAVAMSGHAKVPQWLRAFNIIWVVLIAVVYLYIMVATFMPEISMRAVGTRVHDLATSEVYSKRRIVYAALILPFNCIWFYMYAGHPALIDGDCSYYQDMDGDGLLEVSAPGSVYPPTEWVATNLTEIPAQPNCESVVNTIFDGILGLSGDRWDEVFDFIMRVFSFAAGGVADAQLASLEGDFLADITDIFDLYSLSFENVNLMKEGKTALLVGAMPLLGASFDFATSLVILVAYVMAILRATRILMHLVAYATGHTSEAFETEHQRCMATRDRVLSLTQEVSFLIIRLVAWILYEIPMSLFMLKNIFSIWVEAQEAWKPFKTQGAPAEPPQGEPAETAAREAWAGGAAGGGQEGQAKGQTLGQTMGQTLQSMGQTLRTQAWVGKAAGEEQQAQAMGQTLRTLDGEGEVERLQDVE